MSLHAPIVSYMPEETARIAQAAFPKGNPYMRMHDALGPLFLNPEFAALFPKDGQPAEAPAQLALITIMQFAEGLSDRQTADAVRGRIDWKYALALELTDSGFDASVLSEFRTRLIAGEAEAQLFETMLTVFREQGLIKARGRQRTDSTHVLAAVQTLNRLECIGETMRHTLNIVATVAPAWLQSWVPVAWFDRYGRRFEEYRLPPGKPERYALAAEIGTDGCSLLRRLYDPGTASWLRELPAVEILRQVWVQQFYAGAPDQPSCWRTAEDLPPAPLLISSPYDPDARYGKKRDTEWTGYKVHLTETCDDDSPNVLTNVTTTPATTSDMAVLSEIQAQLATRDLAPREHLVDFGYMTADHILTSQTDHAIDLIGPVADDRSWQAQADNGYAANHFLIDWEAQQATCPQGKDSTWWLARPDTQGNVSVHIRFAPSDCQQCAVRTLCTHSATAPRFLQIRDRDHYDVLQAARQRQHTEHFTTQYNHRAGIEGTISQGTRTGDLRRSRYVGLVKTRLMHLLVGAAINFMRVAAWLAERPRSRTRTSAFAALGSATI